MNDKQFEASWIVTESEYWTVFKNIGFNFSGRRKYPVYENMIARFWINIRTGMP